MATGYQLHKVYLGTAMLMSNISHCVQHKSGAVLVKDNCILAQGVGSPELLHELPKSIVCLTWGYGEEERDYSAKTMDSVGAVQYLCPGVHGWRHIMNKLPSAYANVTVMCEYAKKFNALGLLNTDWGDYGHIAHQDFSIPGMIYGAVPT